MLVIVSNYLKETIFGIIILGALGSIVGLIFIYIIKILYNLFFKYLTHYRYFAFINRIRHNYSEGYKVGFAHSSTYCQDILVGHYILRILLNAIVLLIIFIYTFDVLILMPEKYHWIAFFSGFLVVFPLIQIKKYLDYYYMMFDKLFDKKIITEAAQKYIENTFKKTK
jgi:hypothetical protein